jgi:ribokinase
VTEGDVRVEMIGAVGSLDSHFSSLLQPTLEKSGVHTSRIRQVDNSYTGVAVIIVDSSAGGENRIFFSPGANYEGMQPVPEVLDLALSLPPPDVLVLQAEIPIETVIAILRGVGRWKAEGTHGAEVMFNPAPGPEEGLPADVFASIDHLIMNETECEIMAPKELRNIADPSERRDKIARHFHKLGVTQVLVTLGSKGVWYSAADPGAAAQENPSTWARYVGKVPAAAVDKVVDTTAAGDTFVGAYAVTVARWKEEKGATGVLGQSAPVEELMDNAVLYATRAAARGVERHGAMDSIPWQDEL